MQIAKILGEHVRSIRRLRGLSLERLAELAQLSVTYVGEVERGSKEPSLTTLSKLANALGVSLGELVAPLDQPAARRLTKFELLAALEAAMAPSYSDKEAREILARVRRQAPGKLPAIAAESGDENTGELT